MYLYLISIFLIGLALSMDALAVSIACGASVKGSRLSEGFRVAGSFGFFQALMPILGAILGINVRKFASEWSHWLAFIILTAIGLKMIYEAHFLEKEEKVTEGRLSNKILLLLAIATSLDALATGVSISLIGQDILFPAVLIGIITFLVCLAGFHLGKKLGHLLEGKIEICAGIILIVVGLKILFFNSPA